MTRKNIYLTIAGVASFIVIGLGVKNSQATTNALEVHRVTSEFKKGAVLIDIRSRDDYATEHAAGSINIPSEELSAENFTIDIPLSTGVYIHGYDDISVSKAEEVFKSKGFPRIVKLGTIGEWKDIGGDTIK